VLEYDKVRFSPPAPVAYVTLRHPETYLESDAVPMLIDTGADITLLPQHAVLTLGVRPKLDRQYELVSFDGQASNATAVELSLVFEGKIFRGQFLLLDQEIGILGRNVLNAISLSLHGPQLSWELFR